MILGFMIPLLFLLQIIFMDYDPAPFSALDDFMLYDSAPFSALGIMIMILILFFLF